MNISNVDIYRTAALLIKMHGNHAEKHARSEISDRLTNGETDGCITWIKIAAAIDELQNMQPTGLIH